MFEEDYIMRTIKEMVRALLKFLFGVDTDAPTEALLEEKQSRAVWEELKKVSMTETSMRPRTHYIPLSMQVIKRH